MSDTFTCQFCGEKLPSADTFHDLASCYAHLKVRIDSLEAENARLKMIIDDYRSDIAKVLYGLVPASGAVKRKPSDR